MLCRFVDWLLNIYDTSIVDESRICLLKALLEVLKGNPQVASEVLQTVMGRAQTMLESADDCELLLSACALSLWAAEQDPEAFAASYFHDAVDILVGWHIDAPSESLARRTGDALEQLGPFWAADPNFCATLLGQFVEDLEAYAEDLVNEDPNECLDRMGSLLRVYGTVVHSLGDQAVQVVTWELLSENLHGMANCVLQATEFAPRNSLLVSANQTVVLLCNLTGQCPPSLVDLLHLQAQLVLSEAHTLSLLRLLGSLVQHLGPQIPLPLVSLAFESRWCRSPRARVQAQLLSVQHSMLKLKSVAIVEEAYRCLVQSLDATNMAATALAPLCSLSQVANARHSIIGMWALKPAFFDLLLEYLTPVSDVWHGSPSTQYAMLYLLHSHSQRHGHFISSSTLLIHGDDPGVPRSVYLSRILTLLASVLTSTTVPDDARGLCQHWSLQLVECLQLHMPHLANSTEFLNLVDATIDCGYGNDPEVTSRACQILQRVVDTVCTLLPRDILQRCYSLCVVKAGSAVLNERSKFIALMTLLPVDLLTSEALLSSPELQEQALQRTAILSAPGIILTVQGFRTVMSALLLPPPGGGNIDACELRLERLAPARLASGALKALLADPSPTGIPSLKRAQLLLDFLEHLDKSMYNAYEGSAGSLPAAPQGGAHLLSHQPGHLPRVAGQGATTSRAPCPARGTARRGPATHGGPGCLCASGLGSGGPVMWPPRWCSCTAQRPSGACTPGARRSWVSACPGCVRLLLTLPADMSLLRRSMQPSSKTTHKHQRRFGHFCSTRQVLATLCIVDIAFWLKGRRLHPRAKYLAEHPRRLHPRARSARLGIRGVYILARSARLGIRGVYILARSARLGIRGVYILARSARLGIRGVYILARSARLGIRGVYILARSARLGIRGVYILSREVLGWASARLHPRAKCLAGHPRRLHPRAKCLAGHPRRLHPRAKCLAGHPRRLHPRAKC
ncbi:hypothetical protein MRX96_041715 [Rhipicephalus microplus]